MSTYQATKRPVFNRGVPPDSFLDQLLAWGRTESDDVFAPNPNNYDIYAYVKPVLGPWKDALHRRSAMLEVMRVHAGFESSWNWNEGVDATNVHSLHYPDGQETGIFQVSFDSTYLMNGAMKPFANDNGIGTIPDFIANMKSNHMLAMQYYARLVRQSVQWAGPIKRHEIDRYLSQSSVQEFRTLLGPAANGV